MLAMHLKILEAMGQKLKYHSNDPLTAIWPGEEILSKAAIWESAMAGWVIILGASTAVYSIRII